MNALLLLIIGMLFAYILMDIAHDGTLDGSILRVIREEGRGCVRVSRHLNGARPCPSSAGPRRR